MTSSFAVKQSLTNAPNEFLTDKDLTREVVKTEETESETEDKIDDEVVGQDATEEGK